MRSLYIDCGMGAAGDMLMAALWEVCDSGEEFLKTINNIGLNGVRIIREQSAKCGIYGTHIKVMVNGEEENEHMHGHAHGHEHAHEHGHTHSHSSVKDIEHIIDGLNIPNKVKYDAKQVYALIAEAEAKVHNTEIKNIHFHEVGTMDAVADVVGVCMLINDIKPDKIFVSPVHTGAGSVRCAHGILPVPAPATAYILKDIPIYGGEIQGELCTPTGAALLKYFADEFGNMPVMRVEKTGYGMGTKDFEKANCVRIMLGETEDKTDEISELCCNLDDMTPEETGFAAELLLQKGAIDVYTTAAGMKKSRPGVILHCMCHSKDREKMLGLIFKHTSTIGIREYICRRYILDRKEDTVKTEYGDVRIKTSSGYGVRKEKPEYEDLARLARENDIALSDIKI